MRFESAEPTLICKRFASASTASSTLRRSWLEISMGTPIVGVPMPNKVLNSFTGSRSGGKGMFGPMCARFRLAVPMFTPTYFRMPVSSDLYGSLVEMALAMS